MGMRQPARPGRPDGGAAIALAVLVAIAFALRLIPILLHPSLNWGDEVFQATEQAHRLVYGYGLEPWEFQVRMRSWLLPGFIAGLMQAARMLAPGPAVYLPVIACAFGCLAAAPMVCAFLWCRRQLGDWPAVLAALVAGTAPELIYFGDRTLAEVVAGHVLIVGMYVLLPGDPVRWWRRLTIGGALLGLTLALRIQLLPVVGVLIAVTAIGPRQWWRLAAVGGGFVGVMLATGLFDAVTLGAPFASVTRYIYYNIVLGASTSFGVEPWYYYPLAELAIWGPALLVPLALCGAGTRVSLLPGICALIVIATHMVIGHKEQRFIYPALALLGVQAGFGLAVVAQWVTARLRQDWASAAGPPAVAGIVASLVWCVIAAQVWGGPAMGVLRARVHDNLAAADYVATLPGVCGIALTGAGTASWAAYGGYTHLHQRVNLYWPDGKTDLTQSATGFNVMLLERPAAAPAGFSQDRCFGNICVWRREGACADVPASRLPFPTIAKGSASF